MVSDLPVISNSDCNDVYGIVETELSASTPPVERDLATVTPAAHWSPRLELRLPQDRNGTRSELSLSDPALDARLATQLVSPGPSTTLTGSCPTPVRFVELRL